MKINIVKDLEKIGIKKLKSRKSLKRNPKITLDLRRRPEREEPVKQHGFKEQEIGNNNFLFN